MPSQSCQLSPEAHAVSTVVTAFVGSVLNGLFNGAAIAFITAWICWLSPVRVLTSGLYELFLTFKNGFRHQENDSASYDPVSPSKGAASWLMERPIKTEVTFLGWVGWIWGAVYTPASQTIWLVVQINSQADSDWSGIMLVRSVAVGISGMSLAFDSKQRFGAALGRKLGGWAFFAFNLWHSLACLALAAESVTLAVLGATSSTFIQNAPWLYAIYAVFSCIWAYVSWKKMPTIDGGRAGVNIFVDVLIGAFGGLFVAFPAFMLMQGVRFGAQEAQMLGQTSSSPGLSLGEYLNCEGASFLDKWAAAAP